MSHISCASMYDMCSLGYARLRRYQRLRAAHNMRFASHFILSHVTSSARRS